MTQIIAHRGASKYAPENTMPAFELALRIGADAIETDVQLTKDGIPVLIHDEKLNRTTNGKGFVQDYTFAELQKLDAGKWFSNEYQGTKILSLEELLEWVKETPLLLHLELKNNKIDYLNLERKVYDFLIRFDMQERTFLSSFNPLSMERFKQIDRTIATALLLSQKNKNYIMNAEQTGVSALHIKYKLLSAELMAEAVEKRFSIRVYTVNKSPHLKKCFTLGCNAVFTDVPDLAIDIKKSLTNYLS